MEERAQVTDTEVLEPVEPPDHEAHRRGKTPKVKTSKRLPRRVYPTVVPGISLTNYSVGPSGKGWGGHCTGNRTTITLSNGVRITVRSEIAELATLLLNECLRRGYAIRQADTGAYNCRLIAGSDVWSNHAWGLAIDINWQLNPMRRPLTTNIPVWMRQLFNRFGFAWGGDYSGTPDAMHMEFMGTPAQAAAATVAARRELGAGGSTPSDPTLVQNLQRALHFIGADVDGIWGVNTENRLNLVWLAVTGKMFDPNLIRALQNMLGVEVDGLWGPQTQAANVECVKAIQRAVGVVADGEWGPATGAAVDAARAQYHRS
jgi:hypothetical protein